MKKILAVVALFVTLLSLAPASAGGFRETDGDIILVRPCADGINEVHVVADDGNVYAYLDDGDIYIGRVHLLLSGDEVIDVQSYAQLSCVFN